MEAQAKMAAEKSWTQIRLEVSTDTEMAARRAPRLQNQSTQEPPQEPPRLQKRPAQLAGAASRKAARRALQHLLAAEKSPLREEQPQWLIDVLIDNFEERVVTLESFVRRRGHFPWENSDADEEAKLSKWVRQMRAAHIEKLLQRAVEERLERVRGWTWSMRSGTSSQSNAVRPGVPSKAEAQRGLERVVQRMAIELRRISDLSERRSRIREFLLLWHPDKNPGNVEVVTPIFRWVQSQWIALPQRGGDDDHQSRARAVGKAASA